METRKYEKSNELILRQFLLNIIINWQKSWRNKVIRYGYRPGGHVLNYLPAVMKSKIDTDQETGG